MKFMDVLTVDGTLKMSKIVRGADYFGTAIPEDVAFAMMDRYMELGGNTIDTARIYGKKDPKDLYSYSEPVVGRWLQARGNRKDVVLVTKGGHPDRDNLTKSRICRQVVAEELDMSLDALGVDFVDVYFLHRDNPDMPVGEIVDLLDEHVKAGRMRALGVSNWPVERINAANAYAKANGKTPITISQLQWSIAHCAPEDWNDPTLLCMDGREHAGYLENGVPVMAFSSQAGGYFSKLLAGQALKPKVEARYDKPVNRERLERVRRICEATGKSAAAVCMAYITSNPVPAAAIIGCSTLEQQEDSMSDMDFTLDKATCEGLVQ